MYQNKGLIANIKSEYTFVVVTFEHNIGGKARWKETTGKTKA
jgi:hypothetical protein